MVFSRLSLLGKSGACSCDNDSSHLRLRYYKERRKGTRNSTVDGISDQGKEKGPNHGVEGEQVIQGQ